MIDEQWQTSIFLAAKMEQLYESVGINLQKHNGKAHCVAVPNENPQQGQNIKLGQNCMPSLIY